MAIAALLLTASVNAQQLMPPAPEQPLVAPVMRPAAPDTSPLATDFQNFPTGELVTAGEFKLRPHLSTSYLHADGLPTQSGARVASNIFTFAPGLAADLGSHWSADYTASWMNYSSDQLEKSTSQFARLVGANKSPELDLQLTESYSKTTNFLLETAKQTKQTSWANGLSADHNFGNVMHYHGTVSMTATDTQNLTSTRDWETQHWFRGAISPKVDAGLGLGFGYNDIPAQPNTYFLSYLGSIGWRPTDKIQLSLDGGWQNWHLLSTVEKNQWYPVLDATLAWLPFDQTKISITESRTVTTSFSADSVTDSNSWGVSLGQRLLGKLLLNLAYNQISTKYVAGVGSTLAGRSDDVKMFRSSLAVQLYKYWSLAATYQSSKNSSNDAFYRYNATQYGLELSASF